MRLTRSALVLAIAVGSAAFVDDPADGAALRDGYRLAVPPYRFDFPRDHASHPEFRTEWWYYTGHLEGDGRSFGYQLTFFRVGIDRAREHSRSAWAPHTMYFAHFAVTDERGRRFHHRETLARPALGMAGADTARYHVWIGDWSARLAEDGQTHRLAASADDLAISLEGVPRKPPIVHGENGVSQKASGQGRASHYYSLTRIDTRGTLQIGRDTFDVSGDSWMDHEFGSAQLGDDQIGWDWFSLQLDDGRELMLYVLRLEDGGIEPLSSGTLIDARGHATSLALDDFKIEARDAWTSPRSGAVYPQNWTVRLPRFGLELDVRATVADQELVTDESSGVTYWEGSVNVSGRAGDERVTGRGYIELTGYVGDLPGF